MGVINHDAIVVTGFQRDAVQRARDKALELGLSCSDLVHSEINGYVSFLVAPDGSKEFWADSDRGDEARAKWCEWMKEQWNTGKAHVRWVHVRYGELEEERRDDGTEASIAASWPDRTAKR